jgi:hypothetical protein
MLGEAYISMSRKADVIAFVSEQIGRGAALGAIYPQAPIANQAIDDLSLALARHVVQRALVNTSLAPRDKWLQSAYEMISADQPPLPAGYAAETNVNRLIRWVDPKCSRVLIGVVPELNETGLRDLRSVAEWMNRASNLPIMVVHGTDTAIQPRRQAFKSTLEELLSDRLELDDELRGLFESNVLVLTVFQTSPRVDLLWRTGRLIVEIDSYRYHSSRDRFAGDRQRDYETGVSGYVTLRLTEQEILTDIDLAIQKIRRIVHLRKGVFHV